MAGVSRQTIYAIEAGNYVPNTLLALKLSRILESTVEELFLLAPLSPASPVQLCRVDNRLLASAPAPLRWHFPASDAVVTSGVKQARTKVRIFHPQEEFSNRILVAGCDPGISVLARHVARARASSWCAIVNREAGADTRRPLDTHLKRLGIDASNVRGYNVIAPAICPPPGGCKPVWPIAVSRRAPPPGCSALALSLSSVSAMTWPSAPDFSTFRRLKPCSML